MTTQETIIGKITQAKAIKEAMSFEMPSELFYQMNEYWADLLKEAEELNSHNSLESAYLENLEEIDKVSQIEIIARY